MSNNKRNSLNNNNRGEFLPKFPLKRRWLLLRRNRAVRTPHIVDFISLLRWLLIEAKHFKTAVCCFTVKLVVERLLFQFKIFLFILYSVALASRPQTAASAFDESNLNAAQFIQVTESFMGEAPTMNVFRQLASFVREGYVETEEERMVRITKVFVWLVVKLMLVYISACWCCNLRV